MKTDTKIFDDMFDVAGALKDVNTKTSQDLASLVSQLSEITDAIEACENKLKDLKGQKAKIEENYIPSLMEEMGQTEGTWNGVRVKLVQKIDARITEAKKEAAFEWLRENGHDGIIKNDVTMSFSKGEDNFAADRDWET